MKPKKTVLFCLIIGISCLPGCQKGDDSDTNAIPFTIDFEQRSPTPGAIDLAPDLTFEWTQSQRAVKFELHYGETPDANDVIIKNITTNSYSVTGLTFGARYYWKIVGVDSQRRTASTVTWNFDIKTNFFELNSAFEIPQLNRTTSIWMYLPPDYDSGANQYPVLYMLEGELAFAPAVGAIVGEWHVDETLDQLFKEKGLGVIVVAIANHNNHNGDRCDETLPWVVSNDIEAICREASGPHGGLAEGYLNFIAKTLKPYIDNNYRT
ncbi:MAG: hypothetical protein KJP00_09745, partial [Bacteroidia bacterium]|nr:hypothetical protein [Bacteroidia bacterium]